MDESHKAKVYRIEKTEKLPRSLVVVEAEIESGELKKYRDRALKKLQNSLELPGFRKGHIPESVVIQRVGEMGLLEEAAEEALGEIVPQILLEEKLFVVTRPKIEIAMLAPANPLKFKMTASVMPEFSLPDYKSIAKRINNKKKADIKVDEKEVENALKQIEEIAGEKRKEPLKINDETAKLFGDFKNLEEFKTKIKEDLLADKIKREQEKHRLLISDEIIKETKMDIPEILVLEETRRMEAQFRGDIERMGMKFDDYLAKIKKTPEDLRKEWQPVAEKRAKYDIIAGRIASSEKIIPKAEEIDKETNHLMEHYKDANKDSVRNYVEHTLIHQKVFGFLENQR